MNELEHKLISEINKLQKENENEKKMRNDLEQKLKGSVGKFKEKKDIKGKDAANSDINKLKEEYESIKNIKNELEESNQ